MIRKILMFAQNNGDLFNLMKSASILRLSYMLRKEGYEVKQIHNCLSFTADEIETIIQNFSAGEQVLVCISTSFIETIYTKNVSYIPDEEDGAGWGAETFAFYKRSLPVFKKYNMPVMFGGFRVKADYFHGVDKRKTDKWGIRFLREYVDYFVIGNNIDTILNLCGEKYFEYETISGCKVVTTPDIVDYSDCASTPILSDHIFDGESLSTEIAAGCIFSCQFCNYAALGKKKTEYMRTYESLERELISNYENFKTRVYLLTDNIINDYEEKLKFLIRIREKTGVDIRWSGYVRADTIKTKEQAKLMAEAGIAGATFGIESLKKESGPSIGKMTDKAKIIKSMELFREAVGENCITTGSFIAGLPGETEDELYQTYEWLVSPEGLNLFDNYTFSSLKIYPNQETKNSINISRNDPFRDYKIINNNPSHWTSPWGNSERYQDLASTFIKNRKSAINGFSIPFLNNVGIKPESATSLGRMHNVRVEQEIFKQSTRIKDKRLEEYKKKILSE